MKRGNTALKRGLGLASVFALAVAGAVVAAPAASADPAAGTDAVRALPIADAIYVDANGALRAAAPASNVYNGTTSSTGAVPTVKAGSNSQPVSSFQIAVPVKAAAAPSAFNTPTSLSLPTGVTFTSNPVVTVSAYPVVGASLDNVAGVASGTTSSAATAVSGSTALTSTQKFTGAVSGGTLTITAPTGNDPNAAVGATGFYLLTVQGVRVDVPDSASGAVTIKQASGGTTTIGYIAPVAVSAASASVSRGFDGSVALPAITIGELANAGFTTGYTLQVSSDPAPATGAPAVAFDATATATIAASTGASSTVPAVTAAGVISNVTDVITNKGTLTVSGLNVLNVPSGATVKVSLANPIVAAVNQNSTPATSAFSFTPSLYGQTLSFATAQALPRLEGPNRYATAAAVAEAYGNSANVVLANGTDAKNGADALAANFLAGAVGGPILLTDSTSLPIETQYALLNVTKTAGDVTLYVMGKTDSVSQAARDKAVALLKAAGHANVKVVEVAGADRYATSAAVLKQTTASALKVQQIKAGAPYLPTAFLASGTTNADALAAGGVSYESGVPVLLTSSGDALPADVASAIKDNGITQIVILGGTDRVSQKVEDSLKDLGVTSVLRIAGSDRYETAQELGEWSWTVLGNTSTRVLLANGTTGWPDALSAGPLAGSTGNTLLTVQKDKLGDFAGKFLTAHKTSLTSGVLALGSAAGSVADSVITSAEALLK